MIEVKKIPVRKNPNSTAGPDFCEANKESSDKFEAIIIGSGLTMINGTKSKSLENEQNICRL